MKQIKLGLIREGKTPPDRRVALTPKQCLTVSAQYPEVKIVVQPSDIRCFSDSQYHDLGIDLQSELSDCDIIMGVKEVNVGDLIANKRFFFFSHTIKQQSYNRNLLRSILEKKIQLIDYETLRSKNGRRIIGFGRYAGIVGCYNSFLTLGLKMGTYTLVSAHSCIDRSDMESRLSDVVLPKNTRIVLTGWGRVGNGAREIIDKLPIKEVSPAEFLNSSFTEPIFTHLDSEDYYRHKLKDYFDKSEFYAHPDQYHSILNKYITKDTTMYICCHYWNSRSPALLTQNDLQQSLPTLQVIGDISCDIAGPIASTIRASTIQNPIYGYDPFIGKETNFQEKNSIAVMAVDNLPCELPKDASEDFGNQLINEIFPLLFRSDPDNIILNGSETNLKGELMPNFQYLNDYVYETITS